MGKTRFSAPFDIPCSFCSAVFPKGKKTNVSKKRAIKDGVEYFVLSFDCPLCKGILSVKTDPASGVYTLI